MSKHATVTRLRRHMYKRLDLYSEDKAKLHLLCKLLRNECEIKNTTAIPSSLTVTDTKQNINRSLVNISDEALSFFEVLHDSVRQLQGPHALSKHGASVLNVVKSHILSDNNIQQQFRKCFGTDDDINVINILYNDCVNRYLAVSNNQFRKSLVHTMRSKKTAAHRVEIAKTKTTCGKECDAKKQKKMENICSM